MKAKNVFTCWSAESFLSIDFFIFIFIFKYLSELLETKIVFKYLSDNIYLFGFYLDWIWCWLY